MCCGFLLREKVLFLVFKKYVNRMFVSLVLVEITSNGQGLFMLRFRNNDNLVKVI